MTQLALDMQQVLQRQLTALACRAPASLDPALNAGGMAPDAIDEITTPAFARLPYRCPNAPGQHKRTKQKRLGVTVLPLARCTRYELVEHVGRNDAQLNPAEAMCQRPSAWEVYLCVCQGIRPLQALALCARRGVLQLLLEAVHEALLFPLAGSKPIVPAAAIIVCWSASASLQASTDGRLPAGLSGEHFHAGVGGCASRLFICKHCASRLFNSGPRNLQSSADLAWMSAELNARSSARLCASDAAVRSASSC